MRSPPGKKKKHGQRCSTRQPSDTDKGCRTVHDRPTFPADSKMRFRRSSPSLLNPFPFSSKHCGRKSAPSRNTTVRKLQRLKQSTEAEANSRRSQGHSKAPEDSITKERGDGQTQSSRRSEGHDATAVCCPKLWFALGFYVWLWRREGKRGTHLVETPTVHKEGTNVTLQFMHLHLHAVQYIHWVS